MNEKLIKALSEIYDLCRMPSVGALKCIEIRGHVKAIARKALEIANHPTTPEPVALREEPAMVMSDAEFYSEYED